jgi:hypothetical protein
MSDHDAQTGGNTMSQIEQRTMKKVFRRLVPFLKPLCRRAIVIAWSPSAAGLIGALSAFLEQAIAA